MLVKSRLRVFITCAFALTLMACAEDKGQGDPAPYTGNDIFEKEVTEDPVAESGHSPLASADAQDEGLRYVHATRLRVRTSPELLSDLSNVAGLLDLNDKVRILGEELASGLVEIEILESGGSFESSDTYYTGAKYLSLKPQTRRVQQDNQHKYFMVQNIATEKMRIYEKLCGDGSCAHKMIFETDLAVGEYKKSDPGLATIGGNFHITKWIKFYQDGAGRYPSWYHPSYPMPPGAGVGVGAWARKKVLPYKGAKVRGAFGWYTAFPGPNAAAQWTHGTLGWGSDKKKYIEVTRGFWANLFADPRSHGCSRTDNESIAYVRSLLPVGTPLVKIYAKEAYADPNRSAYTQRTKTWDYILTKNGSQADGELAGRDKVLANGTPKSEWLEEGTYEVDLMPSAKEFKEGRGGMRNGKNGNVYAFKERDMTGVFLVDAGVVVNYRHPGKIRVGGYKEQYLPNFMISKSDDYVLP